MGSGRQKERQLLRGRVAGLVAEAGGVGALAVLGGLLLLYLAVSARNLDVAPPVYEDEPWQASTGWKLATDQVFGSDVFAGFHGAERHYYGFMPVHPAILAAYFKVFGVGLVEARAEAVTMGLLTLILTYALGRRLYTANAGLLAVALLLGVRLTGETRSQISGIPLLDMARIARYDIVVPVFGLASLHATLSAGAREDRRLYLAAGALAGLAGLSHLYGVFWLPALGGLALLGRAGRGELAALGLGFVIPWAPYAAYVLAHHADWAGQVSVYGDRFELFDPGFYWHNLIDERHRYGPGLGRPGWRYALRPGLWVGLAAIPAALVYLTVRAFRFKDRPAAAVLVPVAVFVGLFGLLLTLKLVNYTVTFLPLVAVGVAAAAAALWREAPRLRAGRWVRAAMVVAALAVAVEGGTRLVKIESTARDETAYSQFIAELRPSLPEGDRVLALHNYWFGLEDRDFRSWVVPLLQTDEDVFSPALTLDEALDGVNPVVIVIDPRMAAYFRADPDVGEAAGSWMRRKGFVLAATLDDRTYGHFEIYRLGP